MPGRVQPRAWHHLATCLPPRNDTRQTCKCSVSSLAVGNNHLVRRQAIIVAESATREDVRDLRAADDAIEARVGSMALSIVKLEGRLVSLEKWQEAVIRRNERIPGWLFNVIAIAIPAIGALLYMWITAKFPGLAAGGGP